MYPPCPFVQAIVFLPSGRSVPLARPSFFPRGAVRGGAGAGVCGHAPGPGTFCSMLLTLSVGSVRTLLAAGEGGRPRLSLLDLPAYARQTLGLHGLNLTTEVLAGRPPSQLEGLRERADRAGCACLLLIVSEPIEFGDASAKAADRVQDRMGRVIRASALLGCNAVAVQAAGPDEAGVFEKTAERLKRIMERAERAELNLALSPGPGLTSRPERVTELIKKIGGFRVGTLPDFEAAAASPDPVAYLRRLAPYATVVSASTQDLIEPERGVKSRTPFQHRAYDLGSMIEAIRSVGYDGTLAIDYRGGGDPEAGITRARQVFESLLGDDARAQPKPEDDE